MTEKLYIIVRTDMYSMSSGRIAAQAAHAANMFVGYSKAIIKDMKHDLTEDEYQNDKFVQNFKAWQNQTNDFYGTTIVLDGDTEENITNLLNDIEDEYITGWVIDPEYPVRDGDTVHVLKNVATCAYAFHFGDGEDDKLAKLSLL